MFFRQGESLPKKVSEIEIIFHFHKKEKKISKNVLVTKKRM